MLNKRLVVPAFISILLSLLMFGNGTVHAQEETPHDINHWTYGASAGGVSEGTSYAVRGTLGQQSIYASSGTSTTVSGGIWAGYKLLSPQAPEILVLEKEYRDDEAPIERGDELTFITAVTNNGDDPQTNVVVTDTVPAGLTMVSGSAKIDSDKGTIEDVYSGTVVVKADQLNYEQIAVLTYRAIVDAERGETITSTASARSDTYGPIADALDITVSGPHVVYLPLVARNYSSVSEPVVKTLDDAPDHAPGHDVEIDTHIYQDDFDRENDNDWYAFQAEDGRTYTLETELLGAETDTVIALYDQNAESRLAENDDINWPDNVASRIVWTAPSDGTYHILVRSYDWTVYGSDTGYRFSVVHGEPSSTAAEAETDAGSQPKPAAPPTPTPASTPKQEDAQ